MSIPRKKKPSRTDTQQTNRYFHVLATPLHLINRKETADQENSLDTRPRNSLTGGRRSTDMDSLDIYNRWLHLSTREQQVTYLACQGYKNHQIAFQMGISARTVKSYLEHVYLKMDVRSKTDLRLKFHNFDFERNKPYK